MGFASEEERASEEPKRKPLSPEEVARRVVSPPPNWFITSQYH